MTQNKTVLVIDDDEVFCQLVQRGLSKHNYQVSTAHNEQDALAAARNQNHDFILLDLRLGNDSGLQLIEPLLSGYQDSKIIVMTGYASLATAVKAIKLGAVNYIAKPIDIPALVNVLENPDSDESNTQLTAETPTSLKRLEWEHIQRVLQENDGNISATARQLNMHRRTLQRKLQKKPAE
jgi:two-component system response regulator RegA